MTQNKISLLDLPEKDLLLFRKYPQAFFEGAGWKIWDKQEEIACSVRDYDATNVVSSPGSGKTIIGAMMAHWFLNFFTPSKIIVTAPVERQLKHYFWSEFSKLHRSSEIELLGRPQLNVMSKVMEDWYIAGVTAKEDASGGGIMDKLTGYHSPNIFAILDQADGLPRKVWEAIFNILTSLTSKILALTNPWNAESENANIRNPETKTDWGQKFVNEKGEIKPNEKGEGWNVIRITFFDFPTWIHKDKTPFAKLGITSYKEIKKRIDNWDENSALYKETVLAQDVPGALKTVLTEAMVKAIFDEDNVLKPDFNDIRIGVDVADEGIDFTVNFVIAGPRLLFIKSVNGYEQPEVVSLCMKTAEKVKDITKKKVKEFDVDGIGVGASIAPWLRKAGFKAHKINVSKTEGMTDEQKKEYKNLRALYHWRWRELAEKNELCLVPYFPALTKEDDHRKLREECRKMRYKHDNSGRIQIEDKEKVMKKILGRSPDWMEAGILSTANVSSFPVIKTMVEEREKDELDFEEAFSRSDRIMKDPTNFTAADIEALFEGSEEFGDY